MPFIDQWEKSTLGQIYKCMPIYQKMHSTWAGDNHESPV